MHDTVGIQKLRKNDREDIATMLCLGSKFTGDFFISCIIQSGYKKQAAVLESRKDMTQKVFVTLICIQRRSHCIWTHDFKSI